MLQRSLVLLKPDAVERGLAEDIFKRFEDADLKIVKKEGPFMASDEILLKHYPLNNYEYILTLGHVDVSDWSEEDKKVRYDKNYQIIKALHEYLKSGPIYKMIIEGVDAVQRVRDITGKTDPAASPKGTIRGDFGVDAFEKSDKENRAVRNLIHASGTPEEAEEEIALWFPND
jgi:nucleoside-diphosphate kinase